MRHVLAVCVVLSLAALTLVGSSCDRDPEGLPVSQTLTAQEVEDITPFDFVLPEYLPPGLLPQPAFQVSADDKAHIDQVESSYFEDPKSPVGLRMQVTQAVTTFDFGSATETWSIDGLAVEVVRDSSGRESQISTVWNEVDTGFHVDFYWFQANGEAVQVTAEMEADARAVIASVIKQ